MCHALLQYGDNSSDNFTNFNVGTKLKNVSVFRLSYSYPCMLESKRTNMLSFFHQFDVLLYGLSASRLAAKPDGNFKVKIQQALSPYLHTGIALFF